jgi:hypothetical protein
MVLFWDWTFTGGWQVMNDVIDYLDDGYTISRTIDAEPGVHGPVSFDYRPPLAVHISKLLDANRAGNEAYTSTAIDVAAVQIVKWDKCDRLGKPVPVNKTTLARLKPELLTKITDAMFWPEKKDGEPDANQYAQADATEAALKNLPSASGSS